MSCSACFREWPVAVSAFQSCSTTEVGRGCGFHGNKGFPLFCWNLRNISYVTRLRHKFNAIRCNASHKHAAHCSLCVPTSEKNMDNDREETVSIRHDPGHFVANDVTQLWLQCTYSDPNTASMTSSIISPLECQHLL